MTARSATDSIATLSTLSRYALAVAAPASVSAVQFVVQLIAFRSVSSAEFGAFAFLLVCIQLGYGVSNALIATPFTVRTREPGAGDAGEDIFYSINVLYSILFGAALLLIGAAMGAGVWGSLMAASGALAMVRWFARARSYAEFEQWRVVVSDLCYAASLATLIALFWLLGAIRMETIAIAFLIATASALTVFGWTFLRRHARLWSAWNLSGFFPIWRDQGRWALLGVASAEATSNAHAYVVTLLAGPASFAPLAAAALLFKPVAMAITSLTQLVRPSIHRALVGVDRHGAGRHRKIFLLALMAAWIANVVLALLALHFFPEGLSNKGYDPLNLKTAFALFAVSAAASVAQSPYNVYLQSAQEFRVLAACTLKSSAVSLTLAILIFLFFGAVWSVMGIAIGQILMAWQIRQAAVNWERTSSLVLKEAGAMGSV